MKAAVLHANDDIRYEEFMTPKVSAGEVLVKVKMTGICGSDIPRMLSNGAHSYPIILGHEFSGEIAEIGQGVTNLKIGDKISGAPLIPCFKCTDCQNGSYSQCKFYNFIGSRINGSFAEYVKIPAINAVKFDNEISFEQGAFFEPSTVALHGIRCADYKGGMDVAILGGGTIGLFTMQWAKIFGAKSVTVFDISEKRLELAKKLGADFVINTSTQDFKDIVSNISKGRGFGYVFETAGVIETMQLAFEIAGNKSDICFVGTPTRDLIFTPKLFENMNRKEFKLTGSWMSYSSPFPGDEWELTAHFFKTGLLKFDDGIIFKKIPMKDIKNAFELCKNPSGVHGKILLYNE